MSTIWTTSRNAEGGSGSGEISFSTYGTDTVGDAISGTELHPKDVKKPERDTGSNGKGTAILK